MKITIDGRLPGLNDLIGKSRTNKFAANNEKHQAERKVMCCAFEHRGRMFKNPVDVYLNFYEPNERRDCDNIVSGGCKVILDALVLIGVLADDSRSHVRQIHPMVYTDRKNPRIEIELVEVSN